MKYLDVIYEPITESKPELTLRHLNKLKKIRAKRRKSLDAKRKLAAIMYSDPDQQLEDANLDLEKKSAELDIKRQEMALDIEKSELDNDQKAAIGKKALKSILKK